MDFFKGPIRMLPSTEPVKKHFWIIPVGYNSTDLTKQQSIGRILREEKPCVIAEQLEAHGIKPKKLIFTPVKDTFGNILGIRKNSVKLNSIWTNNFGI